MNIEFNDIITGLITGFMTFCAATIFSKMIKPAWMKVSSDQSRKLALRRISTYLAVVSAISLLTIFMVFSKLWVLLVVTCFCILVLFIVMDYALYILKAVNKDADKERNANRKRQIIETLIRLHPTVENEERIARLKKELDGL